ncbi:MAG TPA: RNA 2'-phosphotransferase, partial [Acidimicrobiales bacterium]|nr:RNA 2'-phosphotransferase [Acidimicrobiales bacterium]
MAPLGRPQRSALEAALRAAGVAMSVVAEAEGWPQLLHVVALGVGVGVANGCVEPEPGTVTRPIEDLPSVTYSAVVRSSERARSHVHLAPSPDSSVGKRASADVLLEISSERLAQAGIVVYRSPNGVLLVRLVPVAALVGLRAISA